MYKKNDIYIQAVGDLYKEEYEKEQKIKEQEEVKKQENKEKRRKIIWKLKK